MIAKLNNGSLVPLHWNDRYYVANCPECFDEVFGKTVGEMEKILDEHCVLIKGYCWMCEHYSCKCEEYGFNE